MAAAVSVPLARTLKIWDAASGVERATATLPGDVTHISVHPRRPRVSCGQRDGAVYVVDLVGFEYGPIVVTPFHPRRTGVARRTEQSEEAVMSIRWQSFRESELFGWFGLSEVGRTPLEEGGVLVRLKPGGFQEHVDVEVELDGNEIVRSATLLLDRAWVGEGDAVSPFASDVAKSFLYVCAPNHLSTAEPSTAPEPMSIGR